MIVTGEMKHFLDLVENTSQCIFLTGKVGTGKSSLPENATARTSNKSWWPPLWCCSCQCGRCYPAFIVQLPFGPFIPNIDLLGYTHDALPAYKSLVQKGRGSSKYGGACD